MLRYTVLGCLTVALLAQSAAIAADKEPNHADLYGQGVHAYFAGDLEVAIRMLSDAIQRDPRDPRPHFFRGLALAEREGLEEAEADFARAAELEAVHGTRSADVSAALQRIQGPLRVTIEQHRKAAQQAAAERKKRAIRARYEQLKQREQEVLVDPNRPAPSIDFSLPELPQDVADPFSSGLALSGGEQVITHDTSEAAEPETTAEPFAPEVRDPFAMPDAPSETEPEDPFATDDPFGDIAPDTPEEPEETGEMIGEDPFGQGAVDPAESATDDVVDELFDGQVNRPTAAGHAMNSVFGVLGKALSGQAAEDRDPFGDKPAPAGSSEPAAENGAENPFE